MPKKVAKPSVSKRIRHLATRRDAVTGRRKNVRIKDWERADMVAMRFRGDTIAHIARTLDRSEQAVSDVLAVELPRYAGQYVDWHMRATEAAAAQGDARPAMEMLDRLGVVPATSRERTRLAVAEMGVRAIEANTRHLPKQSIQIGIAVAGLPPSQQTEAVKSLTPGQTQDILVTQNP